MRSSMTSCWQLVKGLAAHLAQILAQLGGRVSELPVSQGKGNCY